MPIFRRRQGVPPRAGSTGRTGASTGTGAMARSADEEDLDWASFDSVAETYARVQAPQHSVVAADVVELLEIAPRSRVLDVGTGTGAAARAAAKATGAEGMVVGIDLSIPMLRLAAGEGMARFAAARAIDMPFRDATFSHELACFVLGALPNYQTALYEMLRVLSPLGGLGIATWAPGDDRDELSLAWREVAEQFAEREMLEDARERALPWEGLFSDRDRAKDALHDAGLRDIWVEKRTYRFETNARDYLDSREVSAAGRFLRRMLGGEFWGTFRSRVEAAFAERFPQRFNDFREALLIVGHKP